MLECFKCHYRAKYVIAKINRHYEASVSDITKSINILMAIQRAKQAWEWVKVTATINCFNFLWGFIMCKNCKWNWPFTKLGQNTNLAELNELVHTISLQIPLLTSALIQIATCVLTAVNHYWPRENVKQGMERSGDMQKWKSIYVMKMRFWK